MDIKILASWKYQHKLKSMSIPIDAQFLLIRRHILRVKWKNKTTKYIVCLFACNFKVFQALSTNSISIMKTKYMLHLFWIRCARRYIWYQKASISSTHFKCQDETVYYVNRTYRVWWTLCSHCFLYWDGAKKRGASCRYIVWSAYVLPKSSEQYPPL